MLAFISLTSPAMLGGLLLVALPIAAHLLFRHARRKIVFPTIRLLEQSVASRAQLLRLRRYILLTLRCLAVMLIVAAFTRPVWLETPPVQAASSERRFGVVLLLDASASTKQTNGGVALTHRLRAAAVRILDSLSPGSDAADVVYAAAQPQAALPRISRNLPMLREELGRHEATGERADLAGAIGMAGQLLAQHEGRRRLVILSDLQRSNWHEVVTRGDASELLPAGTHLVVYDLDSGVPDNVALSSPRHFPQHPLVNQPMQLVVRVTNYSPREKQVPVEMTLEGGSVSTRTVTLGRGEQLDVTFDATSTEAGEQRASFRIAADGLDADNQAFLVFETNRRLPVVLVSDDDPNEPATASYFVSRALEPHNDGEADRFEVRHLRSRQLTPQDLQDPAVVFVTDTALLSEKTADALHAYVRRGGGLVLFCGKGPVQRNLQALDTAGGEEGLLPWMPGPERNLAVADDSVHIADGKWRSPLLRQFDEQSQIAISEVRFVRYRSAGRLRPDAEILLTFSDGTPALTSRAVGAGRSVLANLSPDAEFSDFGKHGSFVAFVQVLAQQLRADSSVQRGAVIGEPYQHLESFALTDDSQLQVIGPDGTPIDSFSSRSEERYAVQIRRPLLAGFYEIRSGDQKLGTAAINVDARESDLSRIDRQTLLACFEQAGLGVEVESGRLWEPLARTSGRPLWGWCLAVAMACVAVELLCLGIWKQ